MQFFNLFQKESIKLEVCKSITYGFLRYNTIKKFDLEY